jgi:D-glycero-D-manno-heptose 1,7-bisphosphate phosphatase
MPKFVLLDRDGVINEDVGAPGVLKTEDFVLTAGAGQGIGTLKRMGCIVVVITNQSCVGKGLIDEKQLQEMHDHMATSLIKEDQDAILDAIYFCPSTEDQNDPRMKPNPGMILQACKDFEMAPSDCVFVGDTITDLQAAELANVKRKILVSTGYGQSIVGRSAQEKDAESIETVNDCGSNIPVTLLPFHYTMNLSTAVTFLTEFH